ncbi:F-box/LRR-repeat protein 10-like isoform X2 [Juglans microcarpa x Juglans regia]|uniref:F-box/LRR-repeat protein 10-like isoform X2 n=1 Tax=Juglans microcarpa x Juglans regia TaxID=2249226 RepID=UPI001B7F298A|nr:F-box/LRR-repeat protein 10-like isoform X2 [Juglans microcarpa x Juglans regia]
MPGSKALILMFDVSFDAQVWALASEKLTSLEIDYIPSETVIEMVSPNLGPHQSPNHVRPSILSNIQKLCLSVDHITDTMVGTISQGLVSLTHLDLSDAPLTEPEIGLDLTNYGLQQLNQYGKLRRLSLVRRQEFIVTYFRRVNDLGVLFMADKCAKMESICLGGFCRVTDTGFKTILHSCSRLHKLQVSLGTQLTDLVFHDISATSLSLIHVSLIFCNLLTNRAVMNLVSNKDLRILDLRNCKNLGDEALRAISTLPQLKTLLLDGSDISDVGLTYLRPGVIGSLVRLSIRGCRRLTDKCISALFDGSCRMKLRELDLSNIPNLSDYGILLLARSRVPFSELRMQFCPLVGDTAVMALASMQVYEDRWHGSSLRLLDLYECGGITQLAFRWLKKPYFPRLRWLGVRGSVNRDLVDALARNRPYLHVECHGGKLGANRWDCSDGSHVLDYDEAYDYEEVDELEQWLLEGEIEHDDEEMGDAENNAEPME